MPKSMTEDLAWSMVSLAGEDGLGAITLRGLARHVRMAPGTITNHYASKQGLWAECTAVIGRWLAHATSDHIEDRGAVGLFPTTDDVTYHLLVSAWAQVRALAVTDRSVDEQVGRITPLLQRSAHRACVADDELSAAGWLCLEGLRQELVRPGSELTPPDALGILQAVEPSLCLAPPGELA